MKTRFKLLMFVLVVVVAVLCIAACDMGGGGGGDTTTAPATTAAPTTAPPVTTAPPAGSLHPDAQNISVNANGATYTGDTLKTGYAVVGRGPKVKVTLSFQQVDPETQQPLAGVAPVDLPVNAGSYKLTAKFDWATTATDADKAYTLPEDVVVDFVVNPMTLNDQNVKFGAQNFDTFYYAGIQYEIADTENAVSPVAKGSPFKGLTRTYSLAKVDDADGTNPVPVTGTKITDKGYYKVTISYAEPAGAANFANEETVSHSAIVYVREVGTTAQIKKATATIDGVLDAAYLNSAHIASVYQDGGEGNGRFTLPENGVMGDPYEAINMINIHKGSSVATIPEPGVTIYALWNTEGNDAYLYIAIDVKDANVKTRSIEYLAQPDAWVNDSIEFAYKLGGYDMPVLPEGDETFPTYSTVSVDAREKTVADHLTSPNHQSIKQAESVYFEDIQSAVALTTTGYLVELKIPAKSESYTGKYGYAGWDRIEGETLTAGEFVFFAIQQNDLTYDGDIAAYDANIPKANGAVVPKYATDADVVAGNMVEAWKTFEQPLMNCMYCSGNRNMFYLNQPGAGPIVFQLSAEAAN